LNPFQTMTEKLLEKLKMNDRKAQQEFYNRFSVMMFRLVYRYVSNEQDAGSIVNLSFFRIFSHISGFEYSGENALYAWIKKIAVNESLMFLRRKVSFCELDDEPEGDTPDICTNENALDAEDCYRLIRKLPEDLRSVFNLHAIDGFSHKEIALQLGIKESSSRVYLTRARKFLRDYLNQKSI